MVAALTALQQSVQSVVTTISSSPAPVVNLDLSALSSALANVSRIIAAYPAVWNQFAATLDADLKALVAAMPAACDCQAIVDALNRIEQGDELPAGMAQTLATMARLPPELASFMQGTKWFVPKDIADFLARITSPADIVALLKTDYDALPIGTRGFVDWIVATLNGLIRQIPAVAGAVGDQLKPIFRDAMSNTLKAESGLFEPVIAPLVAAIQQMLQPPPGFVTTPGNVGVSPDTPVSAATGLTLTGAVLLWILSYAGIDAGESLKHIGELFAAAVGYEEMRDVVIGPHVRNGIAAQAELRAKQVFQQAIPGHGQSADWRARGIISAQDGRQLASLDALNSTLFDIETTAAQRGLNPRMLLQLIQTGLFSDDDLSDEMLFQGIRPSSQARLKLAAPYIATKPERDALRSTYESTYAAGLLADADLVAAVNDIEQNTDRADLILRKAKLTKLVTITKDLEAEYVSLFSGGIIDDVTFRGNLAAIGLQPDMVDAIAGKAEAKANAALLKQNMRAAAALERTTEAEARKAAMKGFATGQLNAAGLTAALLATGLTALQTGAWVSLAELGQLGNLKHQFGKLVSPTEATLLRERVTALTDQRKREQIDDATFTSQLTQLGIGPREINALRAAADAMISPKLSAFAIPVRTD